VSLSKTLEPNTVKKYFWFNLKKKMK